MDLTNWELVSKKILEWEAGEKPKEKVSVKEGLWKMPVHGIFQLRRLPEVATDFGKSAHGVLQRPEHHPS